VEIIHSFIFVAWADDVLIMGRLCQAVIEQPHTGKRVNKDFVRVETLCVPMASNPCVNLYGPSSFQRTMTTKQTAEHLSRQNSHPEVFVYSKPELSDNILRRTNQ
jgi:hypothetical protein